MLMDYFYDGPDIGAMFGAGVGIFLFGALLYFGTIALVLWIGYLIMRTAVKNGILLADKARGESASLPHDTPPTSPGPQSTR